MSISSFKSDMASGKPLAGTFLKTPAIELVEVLAKAGLDFLCLDAEHSAVDRMRMDGCLAVARALNFPVLVRVPAGEPHLILSALDAGAVGVVIPHVDSPQKAQAVAKAAHFGDGGRGFAGSTRWAGFATRPMKEVLDQDAETVVIAQIEEPDGIANLDAIAATPGIDGLFAGPADLTVSHGKTDMGDPLLQELMGRVGAACKDHGKTFMTFAPTSASCAGLAELGVTMFFIASEHGFMMTTARQTAADIHKLG